VAPATSTVFELDRPSARPADEIGDLVVCVPSVDRHRHEPGGGAGHEQTEVVGVVR